MSLVQHIRLAARARQCCPCAFTRKRARRQRDRAYLNACREQRGRIYRLVAARSGLQANTEVRGEPAQEMVRPQVTAGIERPGQLARDSQQGWLHATPSHGEALVLRLW